MDNSKGILIGSPKPSIFYDDPKEIVDKYAELIFAVERAFPGESRHETALRYIRHAEDRAREGTTADVHKTSSPEATS